MVNKLYLVAPQKKGTLEGNPHSLLYLAEWARRFSNWDINVVKTPEEIGGDADYVGISVTTPTYQTGLDLAKQLKARNPKIKTIFGGYHTKGQGEIIANSHPEIDFIVEGEGEKGLTSILNGQARRIVLGSPLTSEELDSISVDDLMNLNPEYFQQSTQFGRFNYSASRGCPHRCSFCASGEGRKPRAKSIENVMQDLEYLAQRGFRKISIQDNFFGYDNKRMEEICNEILAGRIKIDFDCQTRVESMQSPQSLKLMKDAGCTGIYLGTENFSPEALRRMNKTANPALYLDLAKKAVANILQSGISPNLNLQVGLPYETNEIKNANIQGLTELVNLARTKNFDIQLFTHLNLVYPGTPDFEALKAQGIRHDIFESFTQWEETNAGEIKSFLGQNGFVHGAGGIPLGILDFEALKQGKFEIDESKLQGINQYVERIRKIQGIKIYSPN